MWVCTGKYFFPKNLGGQNTMFDPQVNFRGHLTLPDPRFSRPWYNCVRKINNVSAVVVAGADHQLSNMLLGYTELQQHHH